METENEKSCNRCAHFLGCHHRIVNGGGPNSWGDLASDCKQFRGNDPFAKELAEEFINK